MPAVRTLPFIAVLCSLAAGCAASGSFPSLAPRPEELGPECPACAPTGTPAPAATSPAAPPPIDAALIARISSLLADARRGDEAFRTALPAAEGAVAASGAAGSDSWALAQQAVSRLEAARAPTTVAATELDALARARTEAAPAAAGIDQDQIGMAIEQVRTLMEEQDKAIGRLSGALAAI